MRDAVTVRVPAEPLNRARVLNEARNEGRRSTDRALLLRTPLTICAGVFFHIGSGLLDYEAERMSRRLENQKGNPLMLAAVMHLAALAIFFVPLLAFAQAASLPVITDLPPDQALSMFLVAIGGFKGATALGIVGGVVQILMILLRSPLGQLAGKYKLLIVTGLSLVGGFIGLLISGVSWPLALMHGTVLSAVQVFAHQLIIQLKPETKPEV
jgi:hypothetical protein